MLATVGIKGPAVENTEFKTNVPVSRQYIVHIQHIASAVPESPAHKVVSETLFNAFAPTVSVKNKIPAIVAEIP